MENGAIIGIVLDDGHILVARAAQKGLSMILDKEYGTRHRAAMLVSLGDLLTVGGTPRQCVPGLLDEPTLLSGPCAFERLRGTTDVEFHLFDNGWTHWSQERIANLSMMIEEN